MIRVRKFDISHTSAFYLLMYILTLSASIQYSQVLIPLYHSTEQLWTFLAIGSMGLVFITAHNTREQFLVLCILEVIGIYIYFLIGRTLFLQMAFLIVYCKGKNARKICSIMLKTLSFVFIFNIICTIYYFLFDISKLYIRNSVSESRLQLDLSCGGHPNHAALFWVCIITMLVYLYWEKMNIKYWLLILIFTSIIYYLIGSEALMTLIFLFIAWILRNNSAFFKTGKKIIKWVMPIILFISLLYLWLSYVPWLNNIAQWLNEFSSGRFGLSAEALHRYSITIFGANTEFGILTGIGELEEYVYVDNAFVYMLVNMGVVYLILLWIITFLGSRLLDVKSVSILLVFFAYGLAENNVIGFMSIFPVLNTVILIWDSLYKKDNCSYLSKFV